MHLSRRSLLLAAALPVGAGALAACGNDTPAPEPVAVRPSAPETPEENLLDEFALIGAYLGAIEEFPELRGTCSALADQHRAHARELGASEEQLAAIEPIAPSAVRRGPVITELVSRERAAADMRADSALRAESPERVRALTFICASETSHIPELRDLRS